MNSHSTTQNHSGLHETAPYTSRFACLAKDAIQAFPELAGETLHCTSGHLWVTLENDGADHILVAGDRLAIPSSGKVLVSGPGCYQITQHGMDLRRAS
jgi:hypothetical protein